MQNKSLKLHFQKVFFIVVIFAMSFLYPIESNAASLFVSTSSNSVSVGSEFTLTVKVNTSSKYINNGEGVLSYSKDLVDVVSVSKASSVFDLWITEPTNSKTNGTISFNGGVKTPGFNGVSGTIFSVKFKAKNEGTAEFYFSNSAVRENDGLGTNILTSQSGMSVDITKAKVVPKKEESAPIVEKLVSKLEKLVIYSDTHPAEDAWYKNTDAHFYWENPEGVLAISTLLDTKPDSTPSTKSTLTVSEKLKTDIKDGINYFHVIYKTKSGWSIPTHYTLKIDNEAPSEFSVEDIADSNGKHSLLLKAEDDLSGVASFDVTILGQETINIPATMGSASYFVTGLKYGSNTVNVSAIDFAGNKKEKDIEIISDILEKPILSCHDSIEVGDMLVVNGKTLYSEFETIVYIVAPNGKISKYLAIPNANGEFVVSGDKADQKGKYLSWVEIYSKDNMRSAKSDQIEINVGFSLLKYLLNFPILTVSFLFFIFSILILITAIGVIKSHKKQI